jgi:hypothetical protein
MKKVVLMIAAIVFGTMSLMAQQNATTPAVPNDNPNAPDIKFVKLVHDYGTIMKEADGNCEFEFQNTGKEPLVLSDVRSSCGCTVPQWTREPILPGKKGTIKVHYDTKRVGPINKTVTVMSNAKTPSVVLRITGNIQDNPQATPVKPQTGTAPVAK